MMVCRFVDGKKCDRHEAILDGSYRSSSYCACCLLVDLLEDPQSLRQNFNSEEGGT